MSEIIGVFKGKIEIPRDGEIEYKEVELTVSSFYGGKERGKSLQFSLSGGYIQLDSKESTKLKEVLNSEF